MSRIGNKAISIPAGVTINVADGNLVTVKGPKGELTAKFNSELEIKVEANVAEVKRPNDNLKAIHGTTRALLQNMVTGVSDGYKIELEIVGVGYRAQLQGNKVSLSAGYSHPVELVDPEGVETVVEGQTITVKGIDKEVVGQHAAIIREKRPPEPYKGKGIKYSDEVIRRKVGKTGKK